MKNFASFCLLACMMLATVVWLSAPVVQAQAEESTQQWEHLAMTHHGAHVEGEAKLSQKINQLGRDGWELVTVSNVLREGTTTKTILYFKRAK